MNNKIKKTLVLFLALVTLFAVSTFAYSNTPKNAGEETINVIKLLEIANGDENGNMNFDKEVTRAEFVKMAINASTSKDTAANIKLNVSLFPDVKNSYWGAGYISVAINNGLVNGYLDGTFKPNNPVTLEEAVTIVLRLLGYTSSDLTGSYPSAQIQKYKELALNENIFAQQGNILTREECMILLYNTLSCKNKQGNTYCTTLGLKTNSEGKLEFSSLLEEKLEGPVIVKDISKLSDSIEFDIKNDTKFFLNNSKSSKENYRDNDVIYYSGAINTVYAYRKTATGILDSVSETSATLSGKQYQITTTDAKKKLSFSGEFSEDKAFLTFILGINDGIVDVENGSIENISNNDDNSSLLSMIEKTISKAIYIKNDSEASLWEDKIPFDTTDATIYLNGNIIDTATISAHDVIYHSKSFNSIWIYRKIVSGTIENISSVTSPTSVTLSGKTYTIASSDAAYKLSLYGEFEIGDYATLILGLNNECVAIVNPKEASKVFYGIVTATGEKEYTDKDGEKYTQNSVTVTDTTATSYTFEYNRKHLDIGDVVKVSVSEAVTINLINTDIGKSAYNILSSAVKNGKFSDDCEIIDIKGAEVIKVNPSRISGVQLSSDYFIYKTPVLYHEFNDDGEISKLILKNFTGDIDKYGIVLSSDGGRIKYMTDRNEKSFSTEGVGCSVGPARFSVESGKITYASSLNSYIENIETLTSFAAYDEKGNEYPLSNNIKVFIRTITGYDYSSISDVLSGNYKISAYYDKNPSFGGRIRVIIATRNV